MVALRVCYLNLVEEAVELRGAVAWEALADHTSPVAMSVAS